MSNELSLRENSPAIQAHLEIAQGVIQRMASNSASSKAWCITLVAAILVIIADKSKPDLALIAAIPVTLFLALDTYYLALEKLYRAAYNSFIHKLHHGKIAADDLYVISPKGSYLAAARDALTSFSIWPFYGTLGFMIWIARACVLPTH